MRFCSSQTPIKELINQKNGYHKMHKTASFFDLLTKAHTKGNNSCSCKKNNYLTVCIACVGALKEFNFKWNVMFFFQRNQGTSVISMRLQGN